jgi:hypothetical protein
MAVSKRLRFEILRRDNHQCHYCGAKAPDVLITVDHVIPTTLGGSDDPSNLVAACGPCNSGKSSVPADASLVVDVAADALRWARAMETVATARATERLAAAERYDVFRTAWGGWYSTDWRGDKIYVHLPAGFKSSIDTFIHAGLDMEDLLELVEVAMTAKTADEWRYFCGCCWRRIKQAQEHAAAIVALEDNTNG